MFSPTAYVMRHILPSVDGLKGLDQMDVKGFLKEFNQDAPIAMRFTVLLGAWAVIFCPILTLKNPIASFSSSPTFAGRALLPNGTDPVVFPAAVDVCG